MRVEMRAKETHTTARLGAARAHKATSSSTTKDCASLLRRVTVCVGQGLRQPRAMAADLAHWRRTVAMAGLQGTQERA